MKNSHLKNSLIAAFIAVFAGVVTLGVNVAFSETPPAAAPTSTTLVSPTFGGLDVRGDIKNDAIGQNVKVTDSEGLGVTNILTVPKIKNTTSVADPVSIDDNLEITGSVKNPTAATSLLFDDDLYISGLMDIWGVIKNTGKTNGVENPVVINDQEGLRINFGNLDVWGPIINMIGNPVEISGDLTVKGSNLIGLISKLPLGTGKISSNSLDTQSVYNSVTAGGLGVPFQVGDDLLVTGATYLRGLISNDSGSNSGNVKINDNLDVTGKTTVGGTLGVTGNSTLSGYLDVTKTITANGGLDVKGTLTADSPNFTGTLSSQRIKSTDYGHFNRLFFDYASGLENYTLDAYESYIYNDNNQLNINDDNFFIHAPNAIKLENPSGWARLKNDGNFELGKDLNVGNSGTGNHSINIFGPNVGGQSSTLNLMDTNNYLQATWGGSTVLRSYNGIDLQVSQGTKKMSIDTAGHVTASGGFGKINQYSTAFTQPTAGQWATISTSCAGVEKLLSCEAKFSGSGYINAIIPDVTTQTCTGWGKNTVSSDTITVYAMCINSNG